jgi:hypothetical protein
MTIHLIRTPEYPMENLLEVEEILSSSSGPLVFKSHNYEFNPDQFHFLGKYREDFRFKGYKSDQNKLKLDRSREIPLSWEELFSLCRFFRQTFSIPKDDFVILLTRRKNALNWFSSSDKFRNVFVHTGDWEYYTDAPERFPLAYQVQENIIQTLMNIQSPEEQEEYVHIEAIGCMNDFCQNKKQIMLKLRTADICPVCLEKMKAENIDEEIINQTIDIFELIRGKLLFKKGFTRNVRPKPVRVDVEGRIFVGEKQLNLNPLESALYIFFLKHLEGISLNDLENYKDEIFEIYQTLRFNADMAPIEQLVQPYHNGGTFSVNKSRMNRKIIDSLGESLAHFYRLDGNPGDAFRISITHDQVSLDIRI